MCVICKKMLGKAFSTPPTSPLHTSRVSDDLVFTKVGGDFARPLYVKNIYQSGGETYKCYIALFTCASTRAIHLWTYSRPVHEFIYTSFEEIHREKRIPGLIISDYGTTFKDIMLRWRSLPSKVTSNGNSMCLQQAGGLFFSEICVKLVKRCHKKVLGNAKLSYEELESVLIETEGVLNSSACSRSGCSRQLNSLRLRFA